MIRRLIDEFREFPATMGLCAAWVLVFVLMVLDQVAHGSVPTLGSLALGIEGGRPFGEMTLRDFFQGEVWLPLTATFVHYGLLHIGLNLIMMYQLGELIESWYGPWQFLAVYVAIGFGGNLLSALVRHALGADAMVASGGGSTVVLGLAALCAVVGWRSRTRIGDYLRSQMVGLLVATALLGQIVPIIDNWGHAGGALIGAAIGFAHRTLIRTVDWPMARWVGLLSVGLLIASAAAQVRVARIEGISRERASRWQDRVATAKHRFEAAEKTARNLEVIQAFYHTARLRSEFEHRAMIPKAYLRRDEPKTKTNPNVAAGAKAEPDARSRSMMPWELPEGTFNALMKMNLDLFDSLKDTLGTGATAEDYSQLHTLLENSPHSPPNALKIRAFQYHMAALARRAQREMDAARGQLESLLKESRPPGEIKKQAIRRSSTASIVRACA